MTEHRIQIFTTGSFIKGEREWGWQCFTCGEEETGFINASSAAEAGEQHGVWT